MSLDVQGHVAVVTDSTACLPEQLARQHDIAVVQVQLHVGERTDDEARIAAGDVLSAMHSNVRVSTSPPDANAFFWTYQQAVSSGADAVVSVHISGRMSATVDAAREAAGHVRVPVHVLDSHTTGMSLGFAALTAARVAGAGGNARRVINAVEGRLADSHELIYVDTLEYLRRGGRIGAAGALLGSALSIKPLLTVANGEVAPMARVPGTNRALGKLLDAALERAPGGSADLAITRFGSEERAGWLREQLLARMPRSNEPMLVDSSAVIGAHVGPGSVSVTVSSS